MNTFFHAKNKFYFLFNSGAKITVYIIVIYWRRRVWFYRKINLEKS